MATKKQKKSTKSLNAGKKIEAQKPLTAFAKPSNDAQVWIPV